jgi:hypothetical protein
VAISPATTWGERGGKASSRRPEVSSATGCLRGDLVEEVAHHDGLAQKPFKGQVDVFLQVVIGGSGVSSAKFFHLAPHCDQSNFSSIGHNEEPIGHHFKSN